MERRPSWAAVSGRPLPPLRLPADRPPEADGATSHSKFWRQCLPRLKYWNPAIPMIVNRTTDQSGPAAMTIYLRKPDGAASTAASHLSSSTVGQSKAPEPAADEEAIAIDMKHRPSDAILADLLATTGAVPVAPTPQEEEEMREVEERQARGDVDRVVMRRHLEEQRREEARLAQARNEATALRL